LDLLKGFSNLGSLPKKIRSAVSTVIVEPGEAGRGHTVISLTIRVKPIGADNKRTDFALAA
jgi:hypothetical protein